LESNLQPVTLITGASGGIGAAFAQLFAARGHTCALIARRQSQLDALADAIAASGRSRPHVVAINLEQRDACNRLAEELAARGLEPAIVVNNAGFGLRGATADLDRARQLAIIDLNARVLTDLSLRFVESLARHGGGIINVGSLAGFVPGPGMAVYHASKAYVLAFSEALHRELAPHGVRVTVVCPGPVPTEFHARAGIADDLPVRLTRSAERVARDAYAGFMAGRRVVVPGSYNKWAAVLPRFLPRRLMLRIVESNHLKPIVPDAGTS
jgi:short-subunit dehydrogenase